MKIAIIGTGNVAASLALSIDSSPHTLIGIIGRTVSKAESVAAKYNTFATDDIHFSFFADISIIAVTDSAIENVAEQLNNYENVVLHTSGSSSIDVLKKQIKNCGVLYPFQSFSKFDPVKLTDVPLFIEASDNSLLEFICGFAGSLSTKIHLADSGQRKWIHLAGVFANNYANHCLSVAEELIKKAGYDFSIAEPLVKYTFEKAIKYGPRKSQTGPALRNDLTTLSAHHKMLRGSNLDQIYQLLARHIQKNHDA